MSFLAALTDDLIDLELGPLDPERQARTREWVLARIAGSGQVTRAGLALTGALVGAGVLARHGRAYQRLPADRRRAAARWLSGTWMPPAAEYVKAIRSLAIAYAYEARHADAP